MDTNTEHKELKRNTVISAFSLFFQSGFSAILGLVANLVLTILLAPAVFGIYITVLSLISLLNYFSDIGLAASLVQKHEITDEDISTTFTLQQLLIATIIGIGFLSTNFVTEFYKLPQAGVHLYWALLLSFFISSLKTIPSILLERKILFQKIAFVQVTENVVFYSSVIMFALLGFDLASFTYAVMLRAITGLILIYTISFWRPTFGISKISLHTLLSFGIPFQASSFLALFKDDLIILFLSKVLGFEAVGFIGWAKKWAETPIRVIMDNLSRVLFPVLARIQHDKEKISRLIEKILYYQTMLLAPAIFGLFMTMPVMVQLIPKYAKWEPALPLFYIFCISAFFSSYSTPFMNLFNALGKVKVSFAFMLFWTVTTWLLTPLFTTQFGMLGFPMTQIILATSSLLVMTQAKKIVDFRFVEAVKRPIISTAAMVIGIYIALSFLPVTYVSLVISVVGGAAIYFGVLYFIFSINPVREVRLLFKHE